ncbi:MAG: hypothetical protein DME65_15080 [Verrucomicrobia bacterium]|nr:MAG: hypothetical protein DME65_15080 [Verrucomicrobiota bacterium]
MPIHVPPQTESACCVSNSIRESLEVLALAEAEHTNMRRQLIAHSVGKSIDQTYKQFDGHGTIAFNEILKGLLCALKRDEISR